ncbi:MAG: SsrA-binding protein SmpB [Thermaurantimonas sp.]
MEKRVSIQNRRARFEYEVLDKYIAGMVLTGTEIKSIRQSKVNLTDSYCYFKGEELFVKNLHIAEYTHGNIMNHNPLRDRKLLLTHRELRKLKESVKNQGLTIVPLSLFISDRGFAKLEIALVRGKKLYDKRESIKERDQKREMDRMRI